MFVSAWQRKTICLIWKAYAIDIIQVFCLCVCVCLCCFRIDGTMNETNYPKRKVIDTETNRSMFLRRTISIANEMTWNNTHTIYNEGNGLFFRFVPPFSYLNLSISAVILAKAKKLNISENLVVAIDM